MTMLWRITAPYFVAGFTTIGDTVTRAAPIIGYFTGRPFYWAKDYCDRRGWELERVR